MSGSDFFTIRDKFINGEIVGLSQIEESLIANELFNELPTIEDVLPMLTSKYETAIWWGAYMVSESGEEARRVFSTIVPLIHSKRADIRDIVCECYRWSASSGEHVADVIRLLDDVDGAVRLRAMLALKGFATDLIAEAVTVFKAANDARLAEAAEWLCFSKISARDICPQNVRAGTKINKICRYISAIRDGISSKRLDRFVSAANEPDLKRFHR